MPVTIVHFIPSFKSFIASKVEKEKSGEWLFSDKAGLIRTVEDEDLAEVRDELTEKESNGITYTSKNTQFKRMTIYDRGCEGKLVEWANEFDSLYSDPDRPAKIEITCEYPKSSEE